MTGTALVATDGARYPKVTGRDGETVSSARPVTSRARDGDRQGARRRPVARAHRRGRAAAVLERWSVAPVCRADRRPVPRSWRCPRRQNPSPDPVNLYADDPVGPLRLCVLATSCSTPVRFRSARLRGGARGSRVAALDIADSGLKSTRHVRGDGRSRGDRRGRAIPRCRVLGDATRLPFADGTFDGVVASEVLEHVQDDVAALAELVACCARAVPSPSRCRRGCRRRSTGCCRTTITQPAVGGHVRIYSANGAEERRSGRGLCEAVRHHAHALHSPYWWLRCAVRRQR